MITTDHSQADSKSLHNTNRIMFFTSVICDPLWSFVTNCDPTLVDCSVHLRLKVELSVHHRVSIRYNSTYIQHTRSQLSTPLQWSSKQSFQCLHSPSLYTGTRSSNQQHLARALEGSGLNRTLWLQTEKIKLLTATMPGGWCGVGGD